MTDRREPDEPVAAALEAAYQTPGVARLSDLLDDVEIDWARFQEALRKQGYTVVPSDKAGE